MGERASISFIFSSFERFIRAPNDWRLLWKLNENSKSPENDSSMKLIRREGVVSTIGKQRMRFLIRSLSLKRCFLKCSNGKESEIFLQIPRMSLSLLSSSGSLNYPLHSHPRLVKKHAIVLLPRNKKKEDPSVTVAVIDFSLYLFKFSQINNLLILFNLTPSVPNYFGFPLWFLFFPFCPFPLKSFPLFSLFSIPCKMFFIWLSTSTNSRFVIPNIFPAFLS